MRRLAFCAITACFGAPAAAEDCAAPCAEYEISIELQNDWTFAANPSSATSNILSPSISASLFVLPAPGLGVVGTVTTEPVEDPAFGESANLDGIGSYVEELYIVIEAEDATFRFGKFDPIFSLAGEALPGINATELAADIDADERLGGEADFAFEGLGMNHRLSAAAFSTDRSVLGGSFFVSRERDGLADGGVGNTRGLSSFSAGLTGCAGAETWDCYFDGDFGYRAAVRYQKAGQATEDDVEAGLKPQDELAFVAAATRNVELGEQTLGLLGEAAYLTHHDGGRDDALIITGSAALQLGELVYVATYTQQRNFVANDPDTRDHLADLEAIYVEDQGSPFADSAWEIAAAYTYASNAEAQDRHIFSIRLTFDLVGEL